MNLGSACEPLWIWLAEHALQQPISACNLGLQEACAGESFEQVGAADIAGNGAHVLVVRQLHVALGAAAPYYGYGGDPCLRQQ